MKQQVNFRRVPCTFEVTDEKYEENMRRNAKEIERLRSKARHDEAQALRNAERRRDEHWQGIVADKDARLADKDVQLAEQAARIAELEAMLAKSGGK